ncbi:L-rhamnose mutarotase [Nocardiopsis baichengensis]|uniref:L-rhamnose mutarotase n=1 Tax=Nocardiopsis baichengensis TaxID=280240 RepID=UPI00034B9BC6|nr:L-rhamnose mutarotase [Nocardiopsis baichengensis]
MERVCFRMQVRPDRMEEYIERHRAVWPPMLRALREAGWTNYSLFAQDDGTVIGYLETPDYEAAQARMDTTEINARWQASMRPFFAEGGSFEAGPVRLREVFHLEDQLAAAGATTEGRAQ